jgi:hypothetical protein
VVVLLAALFALALGQIPGLADDAADWLLVREALNLRAAPSAEAAVVTVMPVGAWVQVVDGGSAEWPRVQYQGRSGYAAREYLVAPTAPATGALTINLPVPFQRQLSAVWCDPAIIQSWYEYATGQTVADSRAFQAATWDWELSHNLGFTVEEWNASPYAVASALHHHMPERGFNHWKSDDALTATRMMAWFLAHPGFRQPSVALIWRGAHYVLVRGVEVEGDPYRNPETATIRGVYVLDPNQGDRSWLGANTYIPIGEWTSRHLTPVSYLTPSTGVPGDQWQGKYVTIQADWEAGPPREAGRTPADFAAYARATPSR